MFGRGTTEKIDGSKSLFASPLAVTTEGMNWAPQLAKLKTMSKDQLIEFMRKKGHERKDEEFNQVSFAATSNPL